VTTAQSSWFHVADRWRPALWVAVLLLSATILAFPVRLRYEYAVVQSIHAFGPLLTRFAVLYEVWLGILLLLLFTGGPTEWERLALVCLFALVYFGVWTLATPDGDNMDVQSQLGLVRYLLNTGRLNLDNPNLGYFEYPSFHMVNATLALICGLGVSQVRIVFLLMSGVLTAALLYIWFARALNAPILSSVAVLLMVHGNYVVQSQEFWPGNLAFVFFVLILALLMAPPRTGWLASSSTAIVLIMLMIVFVASYLPTPMYFLFILAGVYLVQQISRKGTVTLPVVLLFGVILAAWTQYVATPWWIAAPVSVLESLVESLSHPVGTLARVFAAGGRYFGGATPLWASLTRIFWNALIYGIGGILWIWNLIHVRKLNAKEAFMTASMLSVVVFGLLSLFALPPSSGPEWARALMIGALFLIPMLLGPARDSATHGSEWRLVEVAAMVLIFAASLPTFLIARPLLFTDAVYPYEVAAGQFLAVAYGKEPRQFYSTARLGIMYTGYLPAAAHPLWRDVESPTTDANGLWGGLDQLVTGFERRGDPGAILLLSERFRLPPGASMHIAETDPRWVALLSRLGGHNETYSNGHVEIYQSSI
jgi:hypothetical protein